MASTKPRVAFAGLGAMGYGMATHLVKSGFAVTGYDVYQPAMERLAAEGGHTAKSPSDASTDADFLVCMVANSAQATSLLFDDNNGAAKTLPQNAGLLMCSTVAPAYIDEVSRRLKELDREDIRLVDSPVSGGAGRAAAGTLSIFAAGSDENLANSRSIMECLSGELYTVPGGLGGGSRTKLVHQIFAGIHIAMASEAMGLAAAAGLDTRSAFSDLRETEGGSWMFDNRVPHMLDPDLPSYSATTIIAKDVAIITMTSREKRFPLPLCSTAEQLYSASISAGWGSEDDCVLVRLFLPGRSSLVQQMAKGSEPAKGSPVSINDIKNLLIGVHLAASSEAMSFCESLGVDTELMLDVVSNAAGASVMFVKAFADMRKARWSLRGVINADRIRDGLVGHR